MLKFKRIVVGISGGVDSAVTALLLKNKGYDVQGLFMQNWDIADETGVCSASEDYKDAAYICEKLQIPVKYVSFVKEYWNEVFMNLIKEYEGGRTPNPDIICNRQVKFNYFFKYARNILKADAIATGHYARSSFGTYLENYEENTDVQLFRARDTFKDQTFFLSQIKQDALRLTMFPLGDYLKTEVKEIAELNNLQKIARKKESMGICFIGTRNFQEFISEYVEDKPGHFIDIDTGKVVGEHKGMHQWTLGQRALLGGFRDAYYIAKKDTSSNTIFVGTGTNHPAVHSMLFFTGEAHWITGKPIELQHREVLECEFKFQHTHHSVDCEVFETDRGLIVSLAKIKRALTPGQFAVFYKGDVCLGSAKIVHAGPSMFSLFWLQNRGTHKVTKRLYKYSYYKCKRHKDEQVNLVRLAEAK